MNEERALQAIWTNFLDANPDDLTSPEDTPDHALVSFDNFVALVQRVADEARLAERERCALLADEQFQDCLATAIRKPQS